MPMAIVSHAEITAQIPEALSALMVTSTGSPSGRDPLFRAPP